MDRKKWDEATHPLHPEHAACDIFGKEKVRFFGGGVPDVFLDKGKVTDAKLEQLLTWRPTP